MGVNIYFYGFIKLKMMSSKKNLLIILLFVSVQCFSQESEKEGVTDVTKVTFFSPGVSYEKRIGKFQTLSGQAIMNGSVTLAYSDALGNMSSIYLEPTLNFQYRFYYNWKRRGEKGKRTAMNSLNYFAAVEQISLAKEACLPMTIRRILAER